MEKYWSTREGESILISSMTDQHLINSYLMMVRRAPDIKNEDILACYGATASGDMASYYGDQDAENIRRTDDITYLRNNLPPFNDIEEALILRGIDIEQLIKGNHS